MRDRGSHLELLRAKSVRRKIAGERAFRAEYRVQAAVADVGSTAGGIGAQLGASLPGMRLASSPIALARMDMERVDIAYRLRIAETSFSAAP
jgi:hypothetical protein